MRNGPSIKVHHRRSIGSMSGAAARPPPAAADSSDRRTNIERDGRTCGRVMADIKHSTAARGAADKFGDRRNVKIRRAHKLARGAARRREGRHKEQRESARTKSIRRCKMACCGAGGGRGAHATRTIERCDISVVSLDQHSPLECCFKRESLCLKQCALALCALETADGAVQ
ncbi:hypothetical protein EVAR_32164_1 [Eumeta japonica]|uniref:Uncharacterized protein n=1 Tax=Eumeta variegata TaxID=151549 RepID=A0A4C1VX53_EUMVA|nr:hypothetical protein EVAR_32164_1 [Eumeta japonica]